MSMLSKNTSNQINFVALVTQLIIEHSRRLETSLMCSNFNKYSFNCPPPFFVAVGFISVLTYVAQEKK